MCQLLGLNCATPTDAVFSFTGFVPRGGRTDHHADGFGLGVFEGKACRVFLDDRAAVDSPVADLLQRCPLPSTNTIAHLRKATHGEVSLANCHPFVRELWGRHWLFAHNGHLDDFAPTLNGSYQPVGTTDSERAFCALLQALRDHFGDREPPMEAWVTVMNGLIGGIAAHGSFNLLLSNGEVMLSHCSTNLHHVTRRWPFTRAHLVDADLAIDFARHTGPQDRVTVIATHPLTHDEPWTACVPGDLLVWCDGALHARMSTMAATACALDARRRRPLWPVAA